MDLDPFLDSATLGPLKGRLRYYFFSEFLKIQELVLECLAASFWVKRKTTPSKEGRSKRACASGAVDERSILQRLDEKRKADYSGGSEECSITDKIWIISYLGILDCLILD